MRNKILLRVFLICGMCCWFILPVLAQTKTITGTVVDDKNEPVQGASVSVKGGSISTVTDGKGNFSLTMPVVSTTLEITHVGFEMKEVFLGNQVKLTISIIPAAANMQADDLRRTFNETDIRVPVQPNTGAQIPRRFLYPQVEVDLNTSTPNPIPSLFAATPVNQ